MTLTAPRVRELPAAGRSPAAFRVVWVGDRPWWLDDEAARAELADVERPPLEASGSGPLVLHARAAALHTLRGGRRAPADRLVADLSGAARLDRAGAHVARSADVVAVDDPRRLHLLGRELNKPWALVRPPLDLTEYAPEGMLRVRRDSELKRFRRLHRLGRRTLLYAGPYRREGGLHLLLDVALTLRERYEDLVVAAIPEGDVDRRYRDACERQALAHGHRAIVEWEVDEATRPLWYALATVVCVPALAPVDAGPALRAAAAGVPLVASAVEPFLELPRALVGELVPPGDSGRLAARLELLLADPARAHAAGAEARRAAERELAPGVTARRLRTLWSGLAAEG